MRGPASVLLTTLLVTSSTALKYLAEFADYNINQNQTAVDPLDYASGTWEGHTYTPSPDNWRFPFYTLFLDRFVNGDPTNDNSNGTVYEHDVLSTQMRHAGDVEGLIDTLDYLQGMGIKGLYLAGSPMINQPWGADGYSILDHTLLDFHYGTIETWRHAINEIHNRGMYVLFDNTFATMGDLLGFEGYLNTTTPFTLIEHKVQYKTSRQYHEFDYGNTYNDTCQYPRFWLDTGYPVGTDVTDKMKGCYDSEFDQYGDVEAFGVFPDWQRQLAKFSSVQDRLREWHAPVRAKLQHFSCMIIETFDIDGFRYDKATQATVDAMGDLNEYLRDCARKLGKNNFFTPGEITGGNTFGSIYIGRGRQPDMLPPNTSVAVQTSNTSSESYFIRDHGKNALDSAAFHYTTYRSLTRFLGMDGNLAAGYDTVINWVDSWNTMLLTNDFVNADTGKYDPRHMYGVSNQDLFRWPGIENGTEKQMLGLFITTLHMPGIPLLFYGEEQAFYVFDNTASNYIYGRSPMSSSTAWQTHGCYSIDPYSSQFFKMPVESAAVGCHDPWISLDHRDPSHPVRNVIKHMYQMRDQFPVLNDGWFLQQLSNQTEDIFYPGSSGVATETGMWSVVRSYYDGVQDLGGTNGNQSVWLVYSNENHTVDFTFDCDNDDDNLNITALIAPFSKGTTVKNLFFPHDEKTLVASKRTLGLGGSSEVNGCLDSLTLNAWEFRAYVPIDAWVAPKPMVTKFVPGHDHRVTASVAVGESQDVDIEIHFSAEMDCDSLLENISFNSTTLSGNAPSIKSHTCGNLTSSETNGDFTGAIASAWAFKATLEGVEHGIHRITVNNATVYSTGDATNSVDHFMFRIGTSSNPVVFPSTANYTSDLLHKYDNGSLYVHHQAPGADKWRYSTNYATTFSSWMTYSGGNNTIEKQAWSGTDAQKWDGDHIIVQYWSRLAGSSSHQQEGDLSYSGESRRIPHAHLNGPYNEYGYDAGLSNKFKQNSTGHWVHNFMWEWPAEAQVNVWGINPDGKPDQTFVYGDVDNDGILDRLPPSSLSSVIVNITKSPPSPHLAWKVTIDDGTLRFHLEPVGSKYIQMILFFLLWIVPVLTGALGIWLFMKSFYQVKFNQIGISDKKSFVPLAVRRAWKKRHLEDGESLNPLMKLANKSGFLQSNSMFANKQNHRRMVLIATMEYDIEDWAIKIKIGGLGVMAQLMGKNLGHQDLIWVVPCVGGVDYPVDQVAEPMSVTVLGNPYEVQVQYHVLRNITYVLLDAPVFRQQTKSEPYPPRMDDLDSAIYYSAWNQCVALAIKRFPIDLYHINDYHGSVAPLYLLPQTIPACLSLHNAEFQGLWPMRTQKEREEVCAVFNLEPEIAQRYVQFGEVFNLLHAGASYLRIHQQGFGAVGVSKKYGKRSYARYPIFWGLKKVGNLPNPDPSDTGEWNKELPKDEDIRVDPSYESNRGELRRQAQEWAGLDQNPKAELFVFVGRWSMQKGIDLIADVFPSVLESNPNVQLITVGPVIDLYGKFAALKLDRMMKLYPGRVYSKPQFTALPPFIFSGAEFALIPSRDEPFGLVAVEFGRKGALGVGARVGGLGQMPGWWYTVESTTTTHLLHQFKLAIDGALASKQETRAMMRARSAKQRFPVAQWVEDLEILQSTAIRIHHKEGAKASHGDRLSNASGFGTPRGMSTPPLLSHSRNSSYADLNRLSAVGPQSRNTIVYTRDPSPGAYDEKPKSGLSRQLSLGVRSGPGHLAPPERRGRRRLRRQTPSAVPESDNEIGATATDYEDDSDEDVIPSYYGDDEYTLTPEQIEASRRMDQMQQEGMPPLPPVNRDFLSPRKSSFGPPDGSTLHRVPPPYSPGPPSQPGTPGAEDGLLPPARPFAGRGDSANRLSSASVLSLDSVVGDKKDFNLQKVDPFFTDSTGEFYNNFEKRLDNLNGGNSESQLCIEEYLVRSEKKWFERFRNARLGRHQSPAPSLFPRKGSRAPSPAGSIFNEDLSGSGSGSDGNKEGSLGDEFLLGKDYVPPTGLKKWMQLRIGDWPVYSIFLGFGQIIAANSYQITLLTGSVGQTAGKLYATSAVFLVCSCIWWLMFRHFKSVVSLSLPFFFYGLAFAMIGLAHYASGGGRTWMQNVGTGFYAVASSSGSVFFALNFGDEGGAPVKSWVFRACVIQGTQQAYVVALWFWGDKLTRASSEGVVTTSLVSDTWVMTAICLPITGMLWIIGILVFFGLPNYYRQAPAKIPSFYRSLLRRKIVLWFFVTVLIQNFFLSAPYGRNWKFLWSSNHAAAWQIVLLAILFFFGVWGLFLWVFSILSKDHSWILPVFAIGLGAPRWCQIWWGTSNVGQYVPWAGGYVAGALVSRSLWLWLGVLDAMQGVGFGMILLQTLTRVHICFTLLFAQVLGSIATICARAFSPNKIGPGPIHPDISAEISALWTPWFFIGLAFNLLICAGFFLFFRKEQLSKP
ncbi:putative alpha-glucan [Phaeomoniella chlamydospora]|uniref:alpha-1,3-glucan synthase n=1 Tax=Phaeomoniella chlamydospora TaxID=158046 RepID=A0A0G2H5X9_PHACM|nr:putative alpha-glucan [Phaeomoniella chlamydospora]